MITKRKGTFKKRDKKVEIRCEPKLLKKIKLGTEKLEE